MAWNLQVWGERIPGYDTAAWQAFYERALNADYEHFRPGDELIWIIEVDSQCVGSIALVTEDDLPDIDYSPWMAAFVIDPDQRSRGIGTEIVAIFEEQCRSLGINRLYLWTEDLGDWYRSLGYHDLSRLQFGEIDATVMAKDLLEPA